jgi:hypothetical protein
MIRTNFLGKFGTNIIIYLRQARLLLSILLYNESLGWKKPGLTSQDAKPRGLPRVHPSHLLYKRGVNPPGITRGLAS